MSKTIDLGATDERNCLLCKHYNDAGRPPGSITNIGLCNRMPPVPVQQVDNRGQVSIGSAFPMVGMTIVCSEYVPNLSLL